ncbi:MAG: HDIG domain-containing protein [Deltaproteobacteria bacterium]|nr:MAG: HDIG domain-containing protein [Deltaproteobacteria bacterium]
MGARLDQLRALLATSTARRIVALVVMAVGTALLTVDYVRIPMRDFQVGEIADHDIRATTDFTYIDWDATLRAQRAAEAAIPPVYDYDATLASRLQARIHQAFELARRRYAQELMTARGEGREDVSEEVLAAIAADFLRVLELSLAPEDVDRLIALRWSEDAEDLAARYVAIAHQRYIIADRSLLPAEGGPIRVVRLTRDGEDETTLEDLDQVRTPEEARQAITLYALDNGEPEDVDLARVPVAIARAAVRPNLSYNQLLTEKRRQAARDAVRPAEVFIQRGTSIVRKGEVLSRRQVDMIRGLQQARAGPGLLGVVLALVALTALVYGVFYVYGTTQVQAFRPTDRDIEAMSVVGLLLLVISRLLHELGDPLSAAVGMDMAASSIGYMAPIAAGGMVIRILCNSETALLFVLPLAAMAGMMMDQQVLFAVYFTIGGLVAAAAAVQSTDRVGILRAGLLTGLVNAGAVLLINLVQVHLGASAAALAGSGLPLWDVLFAFCGGLLSGAIVLVLVPVFELFGFLTDYKLIELANLNHPLLRQLMLRAPGTYHHSVIMGSLCEQAAEAIGANPLLSRVSCYFHDIGKALQPQFFIENQRGGPNPHDRLDPRQSARAIRAHVVDGQALARQYKLPEPVVDGVAMHHGTSVIKYFYVKALEQAGEGEEVDIADFRYPGPIPDTKEAGIMLLADRCEAACRTLREPTANNIRAMVQRLVNDAVTDGQLENCPLTVQELYKIVDSFTETLLGIYHHRIEYPGMPATPPPQPAMDTGPIITLDIDNPLREHASEQVTEEDASDDPTVGPTGNGLPEDPSAELPSAGTLPPDGATR